MAGPPFARPRHPPGAADVDLLLPQPGACPRPPSELWRLAHAQRELLKHFLLHPFHPPRTAQGLRAPGSRFGRSGVPGYVTTPPRSRGRPRGQPAVTWPPALVAVTWPRAAPRGPP